ncbi:MAG: GIY-YIG nuclease family protein [Candidatus Bathyarchaeia archaeon]|jgi:hypothetical protein
MVAKTINLTFEGYWREEKKDSIPADSGIYLVYSCKYNAPTNTVDLTKLIYIGETKDVDDRIDKHEKWGLWRNNVPDGQQLCFAFAKIASPDRERAECALIYYHQPVCCTQCMNSFDYDETTVVSDCAEAMRTLELIKSPITVKRTVNQ